SHLPVLYMVRGGMAVGGAFGSPSRVGVAVAVSHEVAGALRAVGETEADQRLDPRQPAKLAELVNPHIAGINAPPDLVRERRAPVTVANAFLPAVFTGV